MTYDPLINTHCQGAERAQSYWQASCELPAPQPALAESIDADVAIIGAGFTGLMTAYYLKTQHGITPVVLEANTLGFGASGRNAGFVLKGSGRLSYSQMAEKYGLETAKALYQEYSEAVSRVASLIDEHHIACDKTEAGYLKIAHNANALKSLTAQARFIETHMGGQGAEFVSKEQLTNELMDHHEAYGALRLNDGFGVHPLKLLKGYYQLCLAAGIKIYENTLVSAIEKTPNGYHLQACPKGGESVTVKANKVVNCSNAYGNIGLSTHTQNRYLPILSNIIVTAPLSDAMLARARINTHQVTMDTRTLKYYYRLLPDNRILFGGRGAVAGKDAQAPIFKRRLFRAMTNCFPSLEESQIDYNWTGWIAAALDDIPHIYGEEDHAYSLGYCGAGVSFSAQAGFRMAQHIAGQTRPHLPIYTTPLPKFPFAPLRRLGQRAYYHYGWLKDKWF